jgi:hypothetical protein
MATFHSVRGKSEHDACQPVGVFFAASARDPAFLVVEGAQRGPARR